MSAASQNHGVEHADVVLLYALQALPAGEVAAAEAQLAACAACREELAALRPTIASFVDWPTDVLRPATPLWGRLAERIGADAATEPAVAWTEPEWESVAPGIAVKMLASDFDRHRVSMLVRLDPKTHYPPHVHAGAEELHLLEGELWINERKLVPGDFSRAEGGTADHRVYSETGCTCVLVTSPKDVLG